MKIIHDLKSKRGLKIKSSSLEKDILIINFYIKARENKILERKLHDKTRIPVNDIFVNKYYIKGIYTSEFLIPDNICANNTETSEDIKRYILYLEDRNKLIKRYLKILKD